MNKYQTRAIKVIVAGMERENEFPATAEGIWEAVFMGSDDLLEPHEATAVKALAAMFKHIDDMIESQ